MFRLSPVGFPCVCSSSPSLKLPVLLSSLPAQAADTQAITSYVRHHIDSYRLAPLGPRARSDLSSSPSGTALPLSDEPHPRSRPCGAASSPAPPGGSASRPPRCSSCRSPTATRTTSRRGLLRPQCHHHYRRRCRTARLTAAASPSHARTRAGGDDRGGVGPRGGRAGVRDSPGGHPPAPPLHARGCALAPPRARSAPRGTPLSPDSSSARERGALVVAVSAGLTARPRTPTVPHLGRLWVDVHLRVGGLRVARRDDLRGVRAVRGEGGVPRHRPGRCARARPGTEAGGPSAEERECGCSPPLADAGARGPQGRPGASCASSRSTRRASPAKWSQARAPYLRCCPAFVGVPPPLVPARRLTPPSRAPACAAGNDVPVGYDEIQGPPMRGPPMRAPPA